MPRAIGITIIAGPGVKNRAIPNSKRELPKTIIITLLACFKVLMVCLLRKDETLTFIM
jgi:hypothetical protein